MDHLEHVVLFIVHVINYLPVCVVNHPEHSVLFANQLEHVVLFIVIYLLYAFSSYTVKCLVNRVEHSVLYRTSGARCTFYWNLHSKIRCGSPGARCTFCCSPARPRATCPAASAASAPWYIIYNIISGYYIYYYIIYYI